MTSRKDGPQSMRGLERFFLPFRGGLQTFIWISFEARTGALNTDWSPTCGVLVWGRTKAG